MLQLTKHDISGARLVPKGCPEQRFTNPGDDKYFEHNLGRGHTVTELVEALRYKPEGRGFDSP